MGRRFKVQLDIDNRTNEMTNAAVVCRAWGHKWERRAASRRRTLELLAQGRAEYVRYCEHGCGVTWRQVFKLNGECVENERHYPKGNDYLMRPGSGRMRRQDAFSANFARENPSLV
jgi:hypothetical protein